MGVRLANLKQDEDQLNRDKQEFSRQKTILEQEFERLRESTKDVEKRSEEIEKFAKVRLLLRKHCICNKLILSSKHP